MPDPLTRLALLERAVAALTARPAPRRTEQLVPTYLTIKPDGTIGADFTGHVHAQGLDLDAGTTNTPPDQDRVRWIRQADGSVAAQIYGYSIGGSAQLNILSQARSAADGSGVELSPLDDQGNGRAFLLVEQSNRGAIADVSISADAGVTILKLIDQAGRSDFLKLGGARLSTAGTGTINWPGGVLSASSAAVNPGFPNTLDGVIITVDRALPSGIGCVSGKVLTGTTFQAFTTATFGGAPPAGDTSSFSWLAWGT